ncbi:MAG TPA: hypothetical protein VMW49_08860 [Candidatus Dormibacteraeota bacterium]|nr:hypothetical protein [Candidatus Dormibacteraeota bacterium]
MPGLDGVVGHAATVAALRQQLAAGSVAHAYWFTGPAEVGKTTVARALLSEYLGAGDYPGGLAAHPDFWGEDEERGTVRIRQIRMRPDEEPERSLQYFLSLSGCLSQRRGVLIANAERMSLEAANGLLRLLEEPPPGVVICLTTSRPDHEHLPATLTSRCQPLALSAVDARLTSRWLEDGRGVAPERAAAAAALAEGRPGRAWRLASAPEEMEAVATAVDSLLACPGQSADGWLALSATLVTGEAGRGASRALRAWIAFLRDVCAIAAGAPEQARWPAYAPAAAAWAQRLGLIGALAALTDATEGLSRVGAGATPRLVLDRFLLRTFGAGSQSAIIDGGSSAHRRPRRPRAAPSHPS